ncbi:XRE family transcriptional regulator [Citrobacter amalonaticus]|uniref:XRE family transcriptional regulator n=1 Tax=Citrobacter amalonaticus TaxID=35703 RepID=UPI00207C6812|nr:XRE family transcriptional regulator [Citrobacter amalonaticus]MCO4159176.1 XRE family transcriptional regulator [Citrobacter amalonaticus]
MEIKLHANATTTPRIRRYLQQSDKSDRALAAELGISVTTVRRWRQREQTADRQTTPKVIHKAMRQEQIALINGLRDATGAPLDELLLLVNEGLGIHVSRATLNRYLKPARMTRQGTPWQGKKALKAGHFPHLLEVHHLPLSLHMEDGGEHHVLWAREPVSGWCYARLYAGISLHLVMKWLDALLTACPADIQSIETFFSGTHLDGLEQGLIAREMTHKINRNVQNAIQVNLPLAAIVPRVKDVSASQLLTEICESYNTGKAQKKLGEMTPQAFLEALRRSD